MWLTCSLNALVYFLILEIHQVLLDTTDADEMSSPDYWDTYYRGDLVGIVFTGWIPTCVNGVSSYEASLGGDN
jgi:hypothetical protein